MRKASNPALRLKNLSNKYKLKQFIMPGEAFEKAGTKIEVGQPIAELDESGYRGEVIKNEKQRISENIKAINKRLTESTDLLTLSDTLNEDELNLAVEFTEKELDKLGDEFQANMEKANKGLPEKSISREINIADALGRLNGGLDTFLAGRLETIISESDLADADRDALDARLYPKQKTGFGEDTVAAIDRHKRNLDRAANME